jgi:hypothetical protein
VVCVRVGVRLIFRVRLRTSVEARVCRVGISV